MKYPAPSLLICRLEKRQYKTQSFKGREAEARITRWNDAG